MGFLSGLLGIGSKLFGGMGGMLLGLAPTVVKHVGSWIRNSMNDIDEAPSYNQATATFDETKKINELISKCVREYNSQAKEYDKLAEKTLDEQHEIIEKALRNFNVEKNILDETVFTTLTSQFESLKLGIENMYSRKISDVFSPYNNELLDILKLDAGNKKEKLNRLALDTLKDANNEFTNKIRKASLNLQSFLKAYFSKYMKEREEIFEAMKSNTERMINAKDKKEKDRLKAEYQKMIDDLKLLEELVA